MRKEFELKSPPGSGLIDGVSVLHKRPKYGNCAEIAVGIVTPHLASMVRTGLRPAEMAWALDVSVYEIELRLKALSGQMRAELPFARHAPKKNARSRAISRTNDRLREVVRTQGSGPVLAALDEDPERDYLL